jgi:hypothetical protein
VALITAESLVVFPLSAASGSSTKSVWNIATEPSPPGSWYAITYGDGQWVALGHSQDVAVSTDGSSWTEYPVPDGSWQSAAYGDGRFVALSSTTTSPEEIESSDANNWTATSGPSGPWTALSFGDGRFVAVSSAGQIDTSTNGAQWTSVWDHGNYDFTSVAYGNGRFVAVDAALGAMAISTNGVTWSRIFPAPSTSVKWGAVEYGEGEFIAFTSGSASYIATSVNANVWVLQQLSPAQETNSATFGCGTFIGVGASDASTESFISSTSGSSWITTVVPIDAASNWTAVGFGAQRFVAVDAAGNIAWSSEPSNCAAVIPTPPQQVSGNVGSGKVWTYMHPPSSTSVASINSYRVNISNGTITKRCVAPVYFEPNCIISGLENHTVYSITTQSHSRYGYSVPTDPEFVIPVASSNFNATAPETFVAQGAPLVVQITGVRANNEGIYPSSTITVHVGATIATCHPSPFGQCLVTISNPPIGYDSIYARYTGYGKTYQSPTSHVKVQS